MSLIDDLKSGIVPDWIELIARDEPITDRELIDGIVSGNIVAPRNVLRQMSSPRAVGKGLRTKVNANIGTSEDISFVAEEVEKLRVACASGADAIMDLSTGGDIPAIRKRLMAECPVPFGTVPIYQAAAEARKRGAAITELTPDEIIGAVEAHAKDGVDFVTVHTGITRRSIKALKRQPRVMDVVSRGGALLVGWILANEQENPLFERYDELIEICREYEVTLSLGDGMRPGCLNDAGDSAQIEELKILGELRERALSAGVQVMIEGPGHVPLNEVEEQIKMEKEICNGAPFYVLGPLVTDIGAGRDHIVAAIGGAVASMAGADFLCYVTPREHLGLPTVEDVREGVETLKIAAHAGDIGKGLPGAAERDLEMSKARKSLDWTKQMSLALDPTTAERMHAERSGDRVDACSMCGDLCAMKVASEALGTENPVSC